MEPTISYLIHSVLPRVNTDPKLIQKPEGFPDFWDQLLSDVQADEALRPALVPLARNLSQSSWYDELPERIRLVLEERLARERLLHSLFDEELQKVHSLLNRAGIRMLVLGSLEIGKRVYPNRLLRPVNGVELGIQPGDLRDALRILGRSEYRVLGEFSESRAKVILSRKRGAPRLTIWRTPPGIQDEIRSSETWNHSKEAGAGFPVPLHWLSAEDLAVSILKQALFENFRAPLTLNDLHYLISSDQSWDQERLIGLLARENLIKPFWFALRMLSQTRGTELPTELSDRIQKRVGTFSQKLTGGFATMDGWQAVRSNALSWQLSSRIALGPSMTVKMELPETDPIVELKSGDRPASSHQPLTL